MEYNESHNEQVNEPEVSGRLESLLESCVVEEIDNGRIKQMVHARILAERLASRRRLVMKLVGWCAAAACVVAVSLVAIKAFVNDGIDLSKSTLAETREAGYQELVVGAGRRAELRLSDGTRVVANSRSRVLYPERFEGSERRIFVDGEAYLEVAKDAGRPFVVESRGFDVKVLGTVFNICNSSDSTAQVVLVEGSVEVTTDCDNRIRMKPNDLVDLVNGEVASMMQVEPSEYTMWVDGLLSLRGERLGWLVNKLSEHYGLDIECDGSLGDVKVYGKLDLRDSIEEVLVAIKEIVPMEIERDDRHISLGACD